MPSGGLQNPSFHSCHLKLKSEVKLTQKMAPLSYLMAKNGSVCLWSSELDEPITGHQANLPGAQFWPPTFH